MAILGMYGLVNLLGGEPDQSFPRLHAAQDEELPDSDRSADPVRLEAVLPQASPPVQLGETPPASQTPSSTPQPTGAPLQQVLPLARDGARPAGAGAAPAATSTPGPSDTAVATPAPNTSPPTPAPETPAPQQPTPTAAECAAGDATQVSESGNQVRFTYGNVVWYQAGQPGFLFVDVAGTVLLLTIMDGAEVRGVLGSATVVSGQGYRSYDGSIIAQLLEVVCPEWAR